MRAVAYHRVSTLDQDSGLARGELCAAAARFGCADVELVEETGSGARNDRPGLQRVMQAARRGQVDALLRNHSYGRSGTAWSTSER